MKMIRNMLLAVSACSMLGGVAIAKPHHAKKAPNCEVKTKKIHVKNEAACTKKNGKWLAAEAAPAGAETTGAPVNQAPAGGEQK